MDETKKISLVFTYLTDNSNPELRIFYRKIKKNIFLDKDYVEAKIFLERHNLPKNSFDRLSTKESRQTLYKILKEKFIFLDAIYLYEYEEGILKKICTVKGE